MFEQHPVPQNISSYQFHLVGDMTLKQFLEIAGGVVVGLIFYATGLPSFIKWPLILLSVGMGGALAFLPLEERPLEQWIFAFFRSVYSPTLFHWDKRPGVKYFTEETGEAAPKPASTKMKVPFLSKLDEKESSYLNKVSTIMVDQGATASANTPLKAPPQSNIEIGIQPNLQAVQPVTTISIPTAHITTMNVTAPAASSAPPQPEFIGSARPTVSIPQASTISVGGRGARPQFLVQETQEKVNLQGSNVSPATNMQVNGTKQAVFSLDAAPPSVPTIVDTISGQVMDVNKKIIEGAILEIVDESGRAVRALKTNRAGHFLIVTPLNKGKYKIITEKEGYNFDPIEFETSGEIIQPIAITAK